MNNYILKQNDLTMHFFHIPNQGLALRKKQLNLWHNHRIILPDSNGIFSAIQGDDQTINIVSLTNKNEIIYMILGDKYEKSVTLTTLKEEMTVKNISLFKTPMGQNFIYAARYQGKLLLVHCILGDNARPDTIDEIQTNDFSIYKTSVYYTNSDGILGYKNLSDGKADIFNSITQGAVSPYIFNFYGRDFITYIKDNKIYLQNRPLADDPGAEKPVIFEENGKLFVMWQKGDFIRYVSSDNSGETFSPIMQYVSSGKIPAPLGVIKNDKTYRYFATVSAKDIHIFGKDDVFLNPKNSPPESNIQPLSGFKLLLDMEKSEVAKLKKEVLLLSNTLDKLQKNNRQNSDNF